MMMVAGMMGICGCGNELELITNEVTIELGGQLDENVNTYVNIDNIDANNVELDFSGVDTTKVGTYVGYVKNGDDALEIKINVEDTTAPIAVMKDGIVIKVDERLSVEDIVDSVDEASGKVTVTFTESIAVEEIDEVETTENIDEDVEAVEDTEIVTETESDENDEVLSSTFELDGVEVTNDSISFGSMGEYDVTIELVDESGNQSTEEVHVVVGNEPVITGVKDIKVECGQKDFDFTSSVNATDFWGNDITDKIVCDTSKVNFDEEGEYKVAYTVADEYGFTATESVVVTVVGKSNTTSTSASTVSSQSSSTTSSNTSTQSVTNTQDVTSTQDVSSSTAEQSSQQASNTDTSSSEGSQQEVSSTSVSENTVSESTSSTVSDSTSAGSEAPVTSVDASGWTLDELNAATGSTIIYDAEANQAASSEAGVGGSWVTMGP